MNQILTLAVVTSVIFSISQTANCQRHQYASPYQSAAGAQVANLPPRMMNDMRNRQWRAWNASSSSAGQMVAQNFNDGTIATPDYLFVPSQNGPGANTSSQPNSLRSSLYVEPGVANSGPGSYGTGSWQMGSGYTPYVMGDIFGVGRYDYCDEWANLCPCLELTNGRSNCECTNPNRTKLSDPCRHGYRTNQASCYGCNQSNGGCGGCSGSEGGCQGCDRSAKRTTVSEYFHPKR